MKQEPRIGHFLDEEEENIVKAINKDDYIVGTSRLTPERLQALQAAARNTMHEKSTHIPKSDLLHFGRKRSLPSVRDDSFARIRVIRSFSSADW